MCLVCNESSNVLSVALPMEYYWRVWIDMRGLCQIGFDRIRQTVQARGRLSIEFRRPDLSSTAVETDTTRLDSKTSETTVHEGLLVFILGTATTTTSPHLVWHALLFTLNKVSESMYKKKGSLLVP